MVAEIDIDTVKFENKLRTNEAENWQKLRTASLNSKFTDCSYKKKCIELNCWDCVDSVE